MADVTCPSMVTSYLSFRRHLLVKLSMMQDPGGLPEERGWHMRRTSAEPKGVVSSSDPRLSQNLYADPKLAVECQKIRI